MKDIDPLRKGPRFSKRDRLLGSLGIIASLQLLAGLVAVGGAESETGAYAPPSAALREIAEAFERTHTYRYTGTMEMFEKKWQKAKTEGVVEGERGISVETVRYPSGGSSKPVVQTTLTAKDQVYVESSERGAFGVSNGKRWIRFDYGPLGKQMAAMTSFDFTSMVADARFVGTASLRGQTTRHLTARLDLDSYYRKLQQEITQYVSRLEGNNAGQSSGASPLPTMPHMDGSMDVYIDGNGYVVRTVARVEVRTPDGLEKMVSTRDMRDFNKAFHLAVPRPGDVHLIDVWNPKSSSSSGSFAGSGSSLSSGQSCTTTNGTTTCSSSSGSGPAPFSNPWAHP